MFFWLNDKNCCWDWLMRSWMCFSVTLPCHLLLRWWCLHRVVLHIQETPTTSIIMKTEKGVLVVHKVTEVAVHLRPFQRSSIQDRHHSENGKIEIKQHDQLQVRWYLDNSPMRDEQKVVSNCDDTHLWRLHKWSLYDHQDSFSPVSMLVLLDIHMGLGSDLPISLHHLHERWSQEILYCRVGRDVSNRQEPPRVQCRLFDSAGH